MCNHRSTNTNTTFRGCAARQYGAKNPGSNPHPASYGVEDLMHINLTMLRCFDLYSGQEVPASYGAVGSTG